MTDTFTVQTIDGTAQVVTVTINGADDAAANHPPTAADVTIITDAGNGKTQYRSPTQRLLWNAMILRAIRFR